MKQYISFFKLKFTVGLQYRAAAIAGLSTQLFFGFVNIFVYMAFYSSGSSNDVGISIEQLTTYLWLNQAFFALIYIWYRDNDLIKMIRNGDVAYELCRPSNLYIMWFARILAAKLSSALLRGIPLLIIASILPKPYRIISVSYTNMTLPT
ncbi:MAG: ABC transporter permease, partial [Bacilli bacterium]|nr:ABC transporter permease [Bacilli bacterium]